MEIFLLNYEKGYIMKKEIVIASAIAGLLTSLSAGEISSIDINKVGIDKHGKVLAPKGIKGGIKKGKDDEKFNVICNVGCNKTNPKKIMPNKDKIKQIRKG